MEEETTTVNEVNLETEQQNKSAAPEPRESKSVGEVSEPKSSSNVAGVQKIPKGHFFPDINYL